MTNLNSFCNLKQKEDSLRLRSSISDYLKSNHCETSSSASDTSLKCNDKFQLNNRRKSMTVKSMFGNLLFGSSRQKKKRPSLSI